MWRLEDEPMFSSIFASIAILDRAPDFERLQRRLNRASIAVPKLRQRVFSAPGNLGNPQWVTDPFFDIGYHLRRIALPKPGTTRQLLDLASMLAADPLDKCRPLWQFYVVEGLRGGKAALIEKMHHSLSDGEGSIQINMQFFDFQRDAPEPEPLAEPDVVPAAAGPSLQDALRDAVQSGLKMPLGIVRHLRDMIIDPMAIPDATTSAVDTARQVAAQLGDSEKAHSPLWVGRGVKRHVEGLRVPFEATKRASKRLGGTLNTAFLTAAADGAARYHQELGSPVDTLRASMVVSTRTEESGGNAFSLVRLIVPTTEMPIADRFREILAASDNARQAAAGASMDTLSALAGMLPTPLLAKLIRSQSQTVDFATSNLKGSPLPVYLAGAQMMENYPIGPTAGVAFNLTLLSYVGSLDMAANIDTTAVAEPAVLQECLRKAFRALAQEA